MNTQNVSGLTIGTDLLDAEHGIVTLVEINRIPRSNGKRELVTTNGTEHFSRIVDGAQRVNLA